MAVVDMKRLLLAGMKEDQEALLKFLQRRGCVQVTPFEGEEGALKAPGAGAPAAETLRQDLERLRWAVNRLSKHDQTKQSMFSARPAATLADLDPDAARAAEQEALVDRLEEIERRLGSLRGQRAQLGSQIELLSAWKGLDLPLEELRDRPQLKQFLGSLPAAALPGLKAEWAGRPAVIETVGEQRENLLIWAAAHGGEAPAFSKALQQAGFTAASLPFASGTVQHHLEESEKALAALADDQKAIDDEMRALTPRLPALRAYHDALATRLERARAREQAVETSSAFLLRGWAPAAAEQSLLRELGERFPGAVVQFSDPEPGDEPPVLLRNNRFAAPFETVVSGFSLPAYGSLDPTAVMAPFFACFFGMMVSDAGYGLMMLILVPLLLRLMKPAGAGRKLFLLIGIGGVFTVFWGYLYNTWFGEALAGTTILDPIGRPLEVMILCVGLGALHLVAGLVLGAVQHIRRGEYLDVLYDQVSWLMLLAGLGMMAAPGLQRIGQWLALAGALIILVFAGRAKSSNPFKRLLSGLGALYGISSWLSDLLSYLRLFGMGLATGVIGMVFNILIRMVFQTGPVGWLIGAALFVGCHLFNAGINILGAYVHASRLQYIEFFGKFYEEGGAPFQPLSENLRYVRISDA